MNEPRLDVGGEGLAGGSTDDGRPMSNLVTSLLSLHIAEMERLSLGHEDCEDCDEWRHERLVCRDCRGSEDELWTFVLWPCPTIQHVAHALRCYPDQQVPFCVYPSLNGQEKTR